jgi:hypothetical protein
MDREGPPEPPREETPQDEAPPFDPDPRLIGHMERGRRPESDGHRVPEPGTKERGRGSR